MTYLQIIFFKKNIVWFGSWNFVRVSATASTLCLCSLQSKDLSLSQRNTNPPLRSEFSQASSPTKGRGEKGGILGQSITLVCIMYARDFQLFCVAFPAPQHYCCLGTVSHWVEPRKAKSVMFPQGCVILLLDTWFQCLCLASLCREQLVHQLKLEEKENKEKLDREKGKKLTELEVRD